MLARGPFSWHYRLNVRAVIVHLVFGDRKMAKLTETAQNPPKTMKALNAERSCCKRKLSFEGPESAGGSSHKASGILSGVSPGIKMAPKRSQSP